MSPQLLTVGMFVKCYRRRQVDTLSTFTRKFSTWRCCLWDGPVLLG